MKRAGRPANVAKMEQSSGFTASQLATRLTNSLVVPGEQTSQDARAAMLNASFDQAPVSMGQDIIGWVHQRNLGEDGKRVETLMIPLHRTRIVAATTALPGILPLVQSGFVFTVNGEGLSGFIVPSDLERHALRGYFYLLIARIEMGLSNVVDAVLAEREIWEIVQKSAGASRFEKARKRGVDTRIVEYLDLKDLIAVFLKRVPHDFPQLVVDCMLEIPQFRNAIMHATKSLLTSYSAESLARFDLQLQDVSYYVSEAAAPVSPSGWFGD